MVVDPTPREASAPSRLPLTTGAVQVRISSQDRRETLRLTGTALGEIEFERVGDQIRSSLGASSTRFVVESRPGGGGVGLAGRIYPGELVVELHGAGGLRAFNRVALEDYVAGVVPAELVLWSAAPAEIEAQAIAARTYALRSIADRASRGGSAFLWDDTRDQVYGGRFQAGSSAAARSVEARLFDAVGRTRGLVLRGELGELYDIRFHASCGGHTTSPAAAFPLESTLHHEPVRCEPCLALGAEERTWSADDSRSREVHWIWTAEPRALGNLARSLGIGSNVRGYSAPEIDTHGRWHSVEIVGDVGRKRCDLTRLRRELGATHLKSGKLLRTWPAADEEVLRGLYFEGLGRGHGAGLCQTGSHEYATRGWTARAILAHYLPHSVLDRLDTPSAAHRLAAPR